MNELVREWANLKALELMEQHMAEEKVLARKRCLDAGLSEPQADYIVRIGMEMLRRQIDQRRALYDAPIEGQPH